MLTISKSLVSLQSRLIFGKPVRIRPVTLGRYRDQYRVATHQLIRPGGAILEGWSSCPIAAPIKRVAIYFGGRNENVAWVPDISSHVPATAIYAFNYRGFGGSTGYPSEYLVKLDALAIHAYVHGHEPSFASVPLALIGRSLGTAVALSLCNYALPSTLVLMSPFESVRHLLRRLPGGRGLAPLLRQTFDCTSLVSTAPAKSLILLAQDDRLVPHESSLSLADHFPRRPHVAVISATNHKTLPRAMASQAAISSFLTS